MSILTQLLAAADITPDNTPRNSKAGRVFASEPVWDSPDLQRIVALPRRRWQDSPDLPELVKRLSQKLRKNPSVELFPMQAAALADVFEINCSVVGDLGTGKTLITALAPVVLPAKRPVFLNYSRLIKKTHIEFRQLREDWHVANNYDFLSVEALSRESSANFFDKFEPDFVCIDEAQSFANPDGPRFRRLRRWVEEHPETRLLFLTATPGTDSVSQYAHLQELLHQDGSPLPRDPLLLRQMCEATDAKVYGQRRPPGALVVFSSGDEDLSAVREGIGRRVEETEGNIYNRVLNGVDCSLFLGATKLDNVSVEMDKFCFAAWTSEELPDGRSFEEMYDKSLILKQLGCGFAKVLDPTPPQAWRDARGLVSGFVREIVSQEDKYRLDTPYQVLQAVRHGELDDGGLYAAWKKIEPTFTPKHKTEWFDLSVIEFCKDWLLKEKGLLWTTFPTFGRKLAEVSGLPFFHAGGVDPKEGLIDEYKKQTGAILSLRCNMLGRNLQDRWFKNLFVSPPSSAVELDQAIGRTVRRGQKAETVDVQFLLVVRENWESVQTARLRAETDRTLGRNQSSRLLTCDYTVPDLATVSSWSGPRWKR